jgi:hypothetical protein
LKILHNFFTSRRYHKDHSRYSTALGGTVHDLW